MWLVTVDAPSTSPDPQTGTSDDDEETRGRSDPPQERFILYKALSLARAEVLRGRATRIWLAWRVEDIEKEQKDRKVYVFKDAWRDERRGLEGDLYREGPGVAKVYSYNVVRIKGRRDDTLNFIRRGLKPSENDALLLTTDQREAKKILADHPLKRDQYLLPSISHGDIPYEGDILKKAKSTGGPHNRIHTRLIMETYGLPLTRFRSLGEMIGVLRDAIQGHQFLAKESILHRDISQGNILIIPDSTERGYHGVLIDLDFAINLKEHTRATIGDERSGTRAFMSGEILTGRPYSFPPPQSKSVQFTEEDDDMMEPMPTTGRTVKHDAVHDLESFFWVLCWL
ncbi:uncharacterized protein STEHIDRAFT_121423, partial [Stereum hirsutum FP-91666 SS1]|uniref:uncharacterized protein n=1 Tax=Stereum hirsutum (strain FP-91666) TaxID=721885 RepID=UPI000440D0D9